MRTANSTYSPPLRSTGMLPWILGILSAVTLLLVCVASGTV